MSAALVIMAGLPGTGKSGVARELARALPAQVLDKDQVRAALFPPARIEYSTAQDELCFEVMLQVAGYMLSQNAAEPVILDGRTFSRASQVARVAQHAASLGAHLFIIECVCSDATARQRLERDAGVHVAANRSYALYLTIKARFEPIREPKLLLDTDQPLKQCVARCLEYLQH